MAALIQNVAKGKFVRFSQLPVAGDTLIWVVFIAAGLQADATLRDNDTLAALTAALNVEATFGGYARLTASGIVITQDNVNDRTDVDITTDPVWSPTTAQALGAIYLCHKPSAAADSAITPLFKDDFAFTTPTSGTVTYQINAAGFGRAA